MMGLGQYTEHCMKLIKDFWFSLLVVMVTEAVCVGGDQPAGAPSECSGGRPWGHGDGRGRGAGYGLFN